MRCETSHSPRCYHFTGQLTTEAIGQLVVEFYEWRRKTRRRAFYLLVKIRFDGNLVRHQPCLITTLHRLLSHHMRCMESGNNGRTPPEHERVSYHQRKTALETTLALKNFSHPLARPAMFFFCDLTPPRQETIMSKISSCCRLGVCVVQ